MPQTELLKLLLTQDSQQALDDKKGTAYDCWLYATVPLSACLVLHSQSPLWSQWPCLSSCGMLGHVTRPGTADGPSPAGTVAEREKH